MYGARDTKLDSDVALKVLPQAFTDDPDRLARFEREAKVLASLNHPNIGHIYGLEEAEGQKALVLELVEGPTLADRIAQGPIPVDEALPIAKQIAEALEAAHEQGIIHRDLKPANVKVKDDGTVKVLDFGLAKALDTTLEGDPSQSPTLTAAATQMGVIMGTAAYMSPEQARGKPVDRRADVWAFGAVLYEMLTGARPFAGDDVSETLARVIDREPNWAALPDNLPPGLSNFLRHCLQKNPKKRIRDIGDVSLAMEGAFEALPGVSASDLAATTPRSWRQSIVWTVLTLAVAGIVGLAVWVVMQPTSLLPRRLVINLPSAAEPAQAPVVALSPDGRTLVYSASRDGVPQLYLRPMNELTATPLAGTEGGVSPFFSPDSEWIGFFTETELKKVSIGGGTPLPVADVRRGLTGTWGTDDRIVIGIAGGTGLFEVAAAGGAPQVLTTLDADTELDHDWPRILPGGEWLLFTIRQTGRSFDDGRIVVESLQTGERHVLIEGGTHARYVPTGHLVYARSGDLLAAPFSVPCGDGRNPSPSGEEKSVVVWSRATVSPWSAHENGPQSSPGVDPEISEARVDWRGGGSRARFDPPDSAGARVGSPVRKSGTRPRPRVCFVSPESGHQHDCPVAEGDQLAGAPLGVSALAQSVLG